MGVRGRRRCLDSRGTSTGANVQMVGVDMRGGGAVKRKVGRPRTVTIEARPEPWESPAITAQLDEILAALDEVPAIDRETRGVFQRTLYRRKYFGGDAKGQIIFIIRVITESAGNEGALIGPVVSAVASCMTPQLMDRGLAVIEAFDSIPLLAILRTMVGLDVFSSESDLHHWYSRSIRNKLRAILEPARQVKPARVKPAPKLPLSVTRVPAIEKNIALGAALLGMRAAIPGNAAFGRQARSRFDVDQKHASSVMRVARLYSDRPEIYRAASWRTLVALASPTMSPAVRRAFEAKVLAGEPVTAPRIRRARGPLKGGCPQRQPDQPAVRMAA